MLRQIYGRLTLISVLLMVAAIVAIGLSLRRQRLDTIADATRGISNIATILAEQATHSVQSIDIVLQEVADRVKTTGVMSDQPADRPRMTHFLDEKLWQLSQADVVSVADASGRIMASTRRTIDADASVADREFFQRLVRARGSDLIISEPVIGKVTGADTILFARRIENAEGGLIGIAIAGVQPGYVLKTGNAISSIAVQSFVLLNNDGVVFLRAPDPLNRTGMKMKMPPDWRELIAQGGGVYRTEGSIDPMPRWIAVKPLERYPLVVDVALIESVALQSFHDRAWLIMSATLVAMLGFGLLIRQVLHQFRNAIISDAALREREARLSYMAEHDGLTGLANRGLFLDELEKCFSAVGCGNTRFCILLIDLDQFKGVNDSYGHRVGDELLTTFSRALRNATSAHDVVARLGGDEFAILRRGEEASPLRVNSLCAQIRAAASAPFHTEGLIIQIGASIGVAYADDETRHAAELMRNADLALYRAKADGRDCHRIFDLAMQELALTQLEMTNELRRAIGGGGLALEYQPIFDIGTSRIVGMEALARWRHPQRGNIPPTQFIELAEKGGLICQLGEFVVDRACRDAAAWPGHVRVAVNISATHLRAGTLAATVRSALMEAGLDPARLEIEITESAILEDDERSLQTLHALRALGI